MKLMILGLMHKQFLPSYVGIEAKKQGIETINVALDCEDAKYSKGRHDYHAMSEIAKKDPKLALDIQLGYKHLYIKEIVDKFQPNIIFYQQTLICVDFKDVEIPIIYYQTQPLHPALPNGNVIALFTTYHGCKRQLEMITNFTSIISKLDCNDSIHFIPWGWNEEMYPESPIPFDDRKHFIGFRGSMNQEQSKDSKYIFERNIYNDRKYYIHYLKKNFASFCDLDTAVFLEKYNEFMNDVKFAINIQGSGCGANQRQYHILGFGCILIQFYHPYLRELGFIHEENCLIFKNKEELLEIISFITSEDHIGYIEDLLRNSKEFIKENTFEKRSETIIDLIEIEYKKLKS